MMIARQRAVEYKIAELMEWYLENNFFTPPKEICEDKKAYKGKVLRWYEPKPSTAPSNVVLVEEFIGDSWSLRFEPLE